MIILPFGLPGLNDYVRAINKNRYTGNKLKQEVQGDISIFLKHTEPVKNPCIIHFTWVEKNKKRDLDNVAFAKKFILDALVNEGVLQNDSYRYVRGFTDSFEYEEHQKILIDIEELEE